MKCAICGIRIDSVDEAVEAGWTPYFFDGQKEYEPACAYCTASLLQMSEDGEMEVRPEYRGRIEYRGIETDDQRPQRQLIVGVVVPEGETEQEH
jgi:hypothetical protein